jgi:hypothetical protein
MPDPEGGRRIAATGFFPLVRSTALLKEKLRVVLVVGDASTSPTEYVTIVACIHFPARRTERSAGYAAPRAFASRAPRLASTR